MNINTRDLGFVNFNNEEMQWIKFNGVTVYEAWEKLIASGVPPLTLLNCKGVDLVDYKIYGNSVQNGTPTPETPIEVESVGDKTDNLYDIKSAVDNDILVYNGDNTYTFTKTSSRFTKLVDMHIPANTPFTISVNILEYTGAFSNALGFQFQLEDGTLTGKAFFISSTIMTVTFTQAVKKIRLFLQANDEIGTFTKFKNVMINLGTTATDFEPYGYRMPVKARGKNLCSNEYYYANNYGNFIIEDGVVTTIKSTVMGFVAKVKPNTKYTVHYNCFEFTQGTSLSQRVREYSHYPTSWTDGYLDVMSVNSWHTTTGIKSSVFTTGENTKYIIFGFYASEGGGGGIKISNFQVEEGNITDYEPYVEPKITNIYLDEPLTINDYIDYKNQVVSKNGVPQTIELPNIPTIKGTTIIEVDTTIQPSNMKVVYKGK